MNRKVISLLLAGSLIIVMSGCSEKQNEPQTIVEGVESTETVETEVVEPVTEEEALAIDFTGKTLQEIKTFIIKNKENASSAEMDEMVLLYDTELRNNFSELFDKYLYGPNASAIEDITDDEYNLNIELIADEKIKEETLNVLDAGYGFEMQEGSYYLAIDYSAFYDMFGDKVSDDLKSYYELKKREYDDPVFHEEYLCISFKEIQYRITTLETFMKKHPNFQFKGEQTDWLTWYVNALLRVDIFSDTVDYETGKVNEDVLSVYEELVASDLKITSQVVSEMIEILENNDYTVKMDDEKVNNAINELKNKYYDEVKVLVNAFYPAQ